jgi:hypothetical protein
LTYDRSVVKMDESVLKEIHQRLITVDTV